jgi:hypothetical protein
MKARDGDTQTQTQKDPARRGAGGRSGSGGGRCPSCDTYVPAKPGFRLSTMKCPKCGTLLGKQ